MEENYSCYDFELTAAEMAELDGLTTDENVQAFVELYKKCVVRDTPLQETNEGVKAVITEK
jgi:diketogulonate reductase-like aldo/keto reductase